MARQFAVLALILVLQGAFAESDALRNEGRRMLGGKKASAYGDANGYTDSKDPSSSSGDSSSFTQEGPPLKGTTTGNGDAEVWGKGYAHSDGYGKSAASYKDKSNKAKSDTSADAYGKNPKVSSKFSTDDEIDSKGNQLAFADGVSKADADAGKVKVDGKGKAAAGDWKGNGKAYTSNGASAKGYKPSAQSNYQADVHKNADGSTEAFGNGESQSKAKYGEAKSNGNAKTSATDYKTGDTGKSSTSVGAYADGKNPATSSQYSSDTKQDGKGGTETKADNLGKASSDDGTAATGGSVKSGISNPDGTKVGSSASSSGAATGKDAKSQTNSSTDTKTNPDGSISSGSNSSTKSSSNGGSSAASGQSSSKLGGK